MPSRATVYKWEDDNPAVLRQLLDARRRQADTEFEQIRHLADNCAARNTDKARLQIDARKFRVTRMNRALYGDRTGVDLATPEPVRAEVSMDLSKLTPEEQTLLRELSRKALQK